MLARTLNIIRNHPSRKPSAAACLRSEDQAQSLVEFAVCLPFLLLIVTGILKFGVTINQYLQLTNATAIGSRRLAISRLQTTDPCADTVAAIYAGAPTLVTKNLAFKFSLNKIAYSGVSCKAGAANLVQGSPAQVTVTYPCDLAVYNLDAAPGCVLTAQTTELVQ